MKTRRLLTLLLVVTTITPVFGSVAAEAASAGKTSSKAKKPPANRAEIAKGCRNLADLAKVRNEELEQNATLRNPVPFMSVFAMQGYYNGVANEFKKRLKSVLTVAAATQIRLVTLYFREMGALVAAMDPNDPEPTARSMEAAANTYGGDAAIEIAMNDVANFIEKTCGVGTA